MAGPEPDGRAAQEALEQRLRSSGTTQRPERRRELGQVAVLEVRVTGVRPGGPKQVGVSQGEHQGAVAPARGSEDGRRTGPVLALGPGEDLLDDVVLVAAGGRRIEILTSSERRDTVGSDDHGFRCGPGPKEGIVAPDDRAAQEVGALEMHPARSGVAAEEDEEGESLGFPRGRQVDWHLPERWILPGIAGQDPTLERMDLDRTGEGPGEHAFVPGLRRYADRHPPGEPPRVQYRAPRPPA